MLLEALARLSGTDRQIFCAFHEANKAERPHQLIGTYAQHQASLEALNAQGYGIYVLVNHTDRDERTIASIAQFRAIFQDDDKGFQGEYPLPPSLTVQTSPGKFQRYWLISPHTAPALDAWNAVQGGMAAWGNDPSVKDAARVLRLPGTYNMKAEPFRAMELPTPFPLPAVYDWDEIATAFAPQEAPAPKDAPKGGDYASLREAVTTGENYNNSLCSLSMILANRGVPEEGIVDALEGIMMHCQAKDERWEARFRHIPTYARTAIAKGGPPDDDDDDAIDWDAYFDAAPPRPQIPWPPGLLGTLAEAVLGFQHYQNRTLAIVTALGLVAGVAGRKYNVSATGLNLHITVLMDSGMGKDSIQQFATAFLMRYNELGNAFSFLGPKRFTGPKGIYAALRRQRSMLCVFTEASFMLQSSAGDQAGISRALLDIYTKSGNDAYVGGEMFSKSEDSIEPLRAPCLTVINESTPDAYIELLRTRQSTETGELGRMTLFRIAEAKALPNREQRLHVPPDIGQHFAELIKACVHAAHQDNPQAINIPRPEGYWELADWCVEQEAAFRDNRVHSMMYSRQAVKALKLASLCAAMNPKGPSQDWLAAPHIGQEDWTWAKAVCQYETDCAVNLFSEGGSSDMDDLAQAAVKPALIKLFQGGYKAYKMPKAFVDRGIFSYTPLQQVTKNSTLLAKLQDDRSGISPLMKVLRHMESIGTISRLSEEEARRALSGGVRMLDRIAAGDARKFTKSRFFRLSREAVALWGLSLKK